MIARIIFKPCTAGTCTMRIYCQGCGTYFDHEFECTVCGSADITIMSEPTGGSSIRCNDCGAFSPAFAMCPKRKAPVYDIDGE